MNNNKTDKLIANLFQGVANYDLETIYELVSTSASAFGFTQDLTNKKNSGTDDDFIVYMLAWPHPGKEQKFINAARLMGITLQSDNRTPPHESVSRPCYAFACDNSPSIPFNNKMFSKIVEQVVKTNKQTLR